jgi:1,4-alpha-glucan branching enzyme
MAAATITPDDLYLFNEGNHFHLYDKLGAHLTESDGVSGTRFAVWAPNAARVTVTGGFNGWDPDRTPLELLGDSGVWAGFAPGVDRGNLYKYHVSSRLYGLEADKADPLAFFAQTPPETASVVWNLDYEWSDDEWMASRGKRQRLDAPMTVYEVHPGSWMRPLDGREFFGYRELAARLTEYVERMGYTHVELMPVMEHPYYGSWGYQTTGYFAPTGRYGTPQDFMYFIDYLHRHGIGVILDWVPSHFPGDGHALSFFDGTHLYEHADPRTGFHPDWSSYIFNYGRHEVRSFLISSALFWLDKYHADGIRVDAVASMLYLDYSRNEGEWIPNRYGGRENLEAIEFLRTLNYEVHRRYPDVRVIAEESTSWPMVTGPIDHGGLGFDLKWDMGWMHDTLEYVSKDPVHRKHHHQKLSFRMLYAHNENFMLPLSHDEVVYGKGSLVGKMPGDPWQRFANLRALLGYMYAQPGKKLLFMGGDFGQWQEWDHESALDWHLLDDPRHDGARRCVERLNRLYRDEPALHQGDCAPEGFRWVEVNDHSHSVVAFLRHATSVDDVILVAANFTPVPRESYRLGVPRPGAWDELFNSDAAEYGGSGMGNLGRVETDESPSHGQPCSLTLTLPPLSVVFLKPA